MVNSFSFLNHVNLTRERQISYDSTYMQNLKNDTNELIYKTEIDSQTQKTNLWLPKGKGGFLGGASGKEPTY